jgi:ATP-binding cassette subfamily B protein
MVAQYYGKRYGLDFLRESCYITREGVSLLGIAQAAEKIGFRTLMVKTDLETLRTECSYPAIVHWNSEHFIVLFDVKTKRKQRFGYSRKTEFVYIIGDPAHGLLTLKESDFERGWDPVKSGRGVMLLLEPTADFYSMHPAKSSLKTREFLVRYLKPFRKQLVLVMGYMLISTAITVSFPYLTKGLVDQGVMKKSYTLAALFAISQIVLFIGGTFFDIVKSRLMLHVNAKISLLIISDFLKKLLRLPIRFFDSKSVGDVSQRINDHHRIENFLTGDLINVLFSVVNIVIFSVILLSYKFTMWLIFMVLNVAGIFWIISFREKRKKLDYIRFSRNRTTQEKLFEMVVGMQEIKLNGSEDSKRWEWEFLQQRLYKLNIKNLNLEQVQQTGFHFLSNFKNILISFLAAVYVIENEITFGTMLSISFIIGQTNGPLEQMSKFFKSSQDAKLSIARLEEVQSKENEEVDKSKAEKSDIRIMNNFWERDIYDDSIHLHNLSFQYQGPRSPFVLKNLNFSISRGQVTAIIGASGSGKTTLMKLLLGFYQPTEGFITIGDRQLSTFCPSGWRQQCGTVMQDGYIFSDTIYANIALDGKEIDGNAMKRAIEVSNIDEFVKVLPMRYRTKIGSSGVGLSGGQKQRILIARAVYKNPGFLFFDEATSNLDANNESLIMHKLEDFFEGKTVVVIAHRLSTVKKADQIIVLENGSIVETGNHRSLSTARGKYFTLVKNQLELGG